MAETTTTFLQGLLENYVPKAPPVEVAPVQQEAQLMTAEQLPQILAALGVKMNQPAKPAGWGLTMPSLSKPGWREVGKIVGGTVCAGVAAYVTYKAMQRSKGYIGKRIKRWWNGSPTILVNGKSYQAGSVVYESMQAGSDLTERAPPPFQVFVATETDSGKLVLVGSAVRIDDDLYMPTHVWHSRNVWLVSPSIEGKVLRLTNEEGAFVGPALKAGAEVRDLGFDATVVTVGADVLSSMGIGKPKLGMLHPKGTDMANCINVERECSAGRLSDATQFGMLSYTGSTKPGHSGAAYFSAGTLYGIHSMSQGGANLGYSAHYMRCAHRALQHMKMEDTEDFLIQCGKERVKFKARRFEDQYVVKGGGHYFTVGLEVYDRYLIAFASGNEDEESMKWHREQVRYLDAEEAAQTGKHHPRWSKHRKGNSEEFYDDGDNFFGDGEEYDTYEPDYEAIKGALRQALPKTIKFESLPAQEASGEDQMAEAAAVTKSASHVMKPEDSPQGASGVSNKSQSHGGPSHSTSRPTKFEATLDVLSKAASDVVRQQRLKRVKRSNRRN